MTFFIGEKDLGRSGSDDESEGEAKPKMTMKDVQKKYNKMGSKKTRKKEKKLRQAINKINKEKKAAAPKPNFPAIQLLHDPQGATRASLVDVAAPLLLCPRSILRPVIRHSSQVHRAL